MQQAPRRKRHAAARSIVRRSIGRIATATAFATMAALLIPLASQLEAQAAAPGVCGTGDPATALGLCTVTIDARDFGSQSPLGDFTYIINVDNTKLPSDPLSLSTESNSPIVRGGDQDRATVTLPGGRYLVSVRSLDHKMWGAYFTLPADATTIGCELGVPACLNVRVDLTEQSDAHPLPLGKIRVFVFQDNTWTNGAPDTEEGGLGDFQVGLEEQTGSAVTVDYNNDPLCGGICKTSTNAADLGFAEINNLGPATYNIDVHPPEGPCNSDPNSAWYQTTTIDGGLQLLAPTEEGADGTGAPGEQLWEAPNVRTAYWFGFVCAPQPFANNNGTGEITGTARNWVEWAPYTVGTFNDPVENPFVALSDATSDQTVYVGQGDAAGNFDIQNVPSGDYNLAVWDEQLSYIMRFKPVHVDPGQTVDVNDTADDGSVGLGVSRWFGWLDGHVYKDVNGNGQYDEGVDAPIANTDMDQRWRDGSIKESTFTDPSGYYVYPTAEGGALGRWFVNEQGFARFSAYPGASVHDERTGLVTPSCVVDGTPVDPCIPNSQGGGLLTNQLVLEGHRSTVDWGKVDYPAGTPGQIVGITYFATTRNEFNARLQAHEDYEPAIPDVTVYLETPGPDGAPNTGDDVIVNSYVTDHWQHPTASQDVPPDPNNSFRQNCNPIRDFAGNNITAQFNPDLGPNCLEVPLTGQQTKEGAFDGGYAFADYCPESTGGFNENSGLCADGSDLVPLVAGDYIVHAIMPKDPTDARACNPVGASQRVTDPIGSIPGGGQGCLYHIVREEDVNVDLGNHFAPQIPPPPCNGDDHVIDQSTLVQRSYYYGVSGAQAPLCDKHLVVLQNGQNANADFFMMTNFPTDPNGDGTATATGDVAEPGRVIGQVFNDIYFERNQMSNWYGEPRPIANIPVGIYARVDTVPNVSCPEGFDPTTGDPVTPDRCFTKDRWRLIKTLTTSADGAYEILLPSTETFNCPIPQGPCPGMYIAVVDDPGSKAHPNANYNPNLLTANTPFEVWPGLTTQLDTPVDPISGTACEDPTGGTTPDPSDPARPELLQVSTPVVPATGSRQVTIFGDFIGAPGTGANSSRGRITLTDVRTGTVTTLTQGGGGVASWTPGSGSTPDTIVINVPAINTTTFRPGPKQLNIVTANSNPGGGNVPSVNGITLHVLGSNGTGASAVNYTPPVVNVGPPPPTGTGNLQAAIDGAAPGSLIVLSPGTYNENVLVWKPVKIQGLGPGGIIGAHELQGRDPEDPRFNIKGSIVDGRFHQQNLPAFDAEVTARGPFALANAPLNHVLSGADLTVAAQSTTAFDVTNLPTGQDSAGFGGARIDGLGLMTGQGQGAGGVQLMANANNMQITNNVLENNGGVFAGGIGIGQPFARGGGNPDVGSHNFNVRIANDRLIGNGGLTTSGGIGIFYGSRNYELARSVICSNFSVEYGAGVSHIGLSDGGSIHDNRIYYNDSVDSGAGIAIEGELVVGGGLSDGSGAVKIDRNLIQSNYSGDDGGGLFVLDSLHAQIDVRNNMIVNNGASDMGGAITLDDASNVRIINNTVANNVTTGASENSAIGVPHAAGLATEANDPLYQATLTPRTDSNATTNDGTVVLDPAIVAADNGRTVVGAGIPGGTTITGVTPGVSFTMSNPATTTATGVSLSIRRTATGTVASGSNLVTNVAAITGADVGRQVVFTPGIGGSNTRTITGVNVGLHRFTFSGNPSNANGTRTLSIRKTDANGTTNDGTLVRDPGVTANDVGKAVSGPGIPDGATIYQVTPGVSFTLNRAATIAAGPVSLDIVFAEFSNPVALFNNIFWNNDAMTLDQFGPGATLVDQGSIDFEIRGGTLNPADTFTPRYSDLTNGLLLGPDGSQNPVPGGQGNLIGSDPAFVAPFILELTVSGSRLDPQQAAVTITGQDPPVGLTGDYHITTGSPVVDRGAGFSGLAVPAPATQTPNASSVLAPCSGNTAQALTGTGFPGDFDRQWRPQLRSTRVRTPWDMGADELPLLPLTIPSSTFVWNGTGQLQCSASTEIR